MKTSGGDNNNNCENEGKNDNNFFVLMEVFLNLFNYNFYLFFNDVLMSFFLLEMINSSKIYSCRSIQLHSLNLYGLIFKILPIRVGQTGPVNKIYTERVIEGSNNITPKVSVLVQDSSRNEA